MRVTVFPYKRSIGFSRPMAEAMRLIAAWRGTTVADIVRDSVEHTLLREFALRGVSFPSQADPVLEGQMELSRLSADLGDPAEPMHEGQ